MTVIADIENDVEFGVNRGHMNNNYQNLNDHKLEALQVLIRGNQSSFTPVEDYDPATKIYVDQGVNGIWLILDPNNIRGDAFARGNHTGTQAPATIATTDLAQFVAATQIANWDAKEPAIGTKGTAFNVNFGTVAGTAAQGNHTHTKGDIGLDRVDNTNDAEKVISDATQSALGTKADTTYVDNEIATKIDREDNPYLNFAAQTVGRTNEGDIFYANDSKSLSLVTDIVGFTHNLGQEEVIRVINLSGATILNATPVRQTGASGGLPTIEPAIADIIENSLVQGITTHEIADGSEGFMTYSGKLGGNFSAFAINDRLFLSDTVPGGYTTTAPDIVTFLGTVMDNSTEGNILTKIRTLTSIPPAVAFMAGATAPATLTGGQVYPISGYDPALSGNVILSYDPVAGTIITPVTGIFRTTINIVLTHDTNNNERIQNLEIYNVTDAAVALSVPQSIGRETGSTNISLSITFSAIAGRTYQLRLAPTDTFATVTTNLLGFSMESIHIYVG